MLMYARTGCGNVAVCIREAIHNDMDDDGGCRKEGGGTKIPPLPPSRHTISDHVLLQWLNQKLPIRFQH